MSLLLFLILCLAVSAVKQPFANHYLNSLEAFSLLSSSITIYCGIFFIADASFKEEDNCKNKTGVHIKHS